MVRQEDAVFVFFKMREVVLRSSLSGNSQCFGYGRSHAGSTGTAAAHRSHSRPLRHAAAEHYGGAGIAPDIVRWPETADPAGADLSAVPLKWLFVTASKQDPNLFPVGEGFGFFALPFKS